MKNQTSTSAVTANGGNVLVIGSKSFTSYEQYEKEYQKEWDRVHTNAQCDLNWCRKDWETRMKHPELYR